MSRMAGTIDIVRVKLTAQATIEQLIFFFLEMCFTHMNIVRFFFVTHIHALRPTTKTKK